MARLLKIAIFLAFLATPAFAQDVEAPDFLTLAHALVPALTLVFTFAVGWAVSKVRGSIPDVLLPLVAMITGPVVEWLLAYAEILGATNPYLGVVLGAFSTALHQIYSKGKATIDSEVPTPLKAYQ